MRYRGHGILRSISSRTICRAIFLVSEWDGRIWSAAVPAALDHSEWDVRTTIAWRNSNVIRTKAVQSPALQILPAWWENSLTCQSNSNVQTPMPTHSRQPPEFFLQASATFQDFRKTNWVSSSLGNVASTNFSSPGIDVFKKIFSKFINTFVFG